MNSAVKIDTVTSQTGQCSLKPDQEFKRTQLQPLYEGMRVFLFLRGGGGGRGEGDMQ